MEEISTIIRAVKPLDEAIMNETRQHLDRLTKPQGSLAVLERMACQLAGVQGVAKPAAPDMSAPG